MWGSSIATKAMPDGIDQSPARDLGLFLVLVVLVNGLVVPGAASTGHFMQTFYLALFVHVGFTLYDGSFNALRTATWLLLIATWAGSEIVSFLGYMLPAGQLVFWLATVPVVRDVLAGWYGSGTPSTPGASVLWLVLPLVVLGFDIAVMHHGRWQTSSLRQVAIFLVAVGIAALLLGFALGAVLDRSVPSDVANGPYQFPIVSSWHELPFYALLRAVPSKAGGVALMFASMLVPMIWPWMRADELRRGRTRRVWPLLCLALAAAWIGLGYLGSRGPDNVTVRATLALALFYFAFFLLLPPVLRRFAGSAAA